MRLACLDMIMYTHAELMAIESACKEHLNLYICKEVICDVNKLVKCAKSDIEIVNEYKREDGWWVKKLLENLKCIFNF